LFYLWTGVGEDLDTPSQIFSNVRMSDDRLEELASPYFVFKDAGFEITVASIKGGEIPVDPASLQGDFKTAEATKFLELCTYRSLVDVP
jgi:hypothetical protein